MGKNDEWWNPYNKVGRLKGKGSTTWARQARRAAQFAGNTDQQPLEKGHAEMQKEKKTEAMEVIQEETQQPLEKKEKQQMTPKRKGQHPKNWSPRRLKKRRQQVEPQPALPQESMQSPWKKRQ